MLVLRVAPCWPWQAVIVAQNRFRHALERDGVKLVLVLHMQLEPLWALAGIADRPSALVDLAQHILCNGLFVLHIDMLEHFVCKPKGFGQQVGNLVIRLRLEQRIEYLVTPLQRPARVRHRSVDFSGRGCGQQVHVVLLVRHNRDLRRMRVNHAKHIDFIQRLALLWPACDRVRGMAPEHHRFDRIGLV